jgi:hypothetical protein
VLVAPEVRSQGFDFVAQLGLHPSSIIMRRCAQPSFLTPSPAVCEGGAYGFWTPRWTL